MMNHPLQTPGFALIAGLAAVASEVSADVKLPPVFADHMVLQQQVKLPVWGTAGPGEGVTVKIAGQSVLTTAGNDGRWKLELMPLSIGDPLEMTVQGNNTVTFKDVRVGEVWVCCGQSNMALTLNATKDSAREIAAANFPNLRLFNGTGGPWTLCSPQPAAPFSAVAYYFGKHLQEGLDPVPIGLINISFSGTATEAWMPRESPEAAVILGLRQESYRLNNAKYQADFERWKMDCEKAKAAGQPVPPEPRKMKRTAPAGIETPGQYWPRVVAMAPYGIRGVIWYQGEANCWSIPAAEYQRVLLPAMIAQWRQTWGQGDFPFLMVQLPNYNYHPPYDSNTWPAFREAQQHVLDTVPNTGLAITLDVGDMSNIHPVNKQPVGQRLALWALTHTYGKQGLVFTGPRYKSVSVEGDKVRLTFDHVGGGLTWRDGKVTTGFEIAGADGKYVQATPQIDGNTVVLHRPEVASPVAARYGWGDESLLTLMNKEGLPAWPLRSNP
ncbi:MAG: sialate O-acetylesterase [Verrucomicrobia bacterium]|nr:sialate O-acetylesterase [Verrucomicrobiota bacterium]